MLTFQTLICNEAVDYDGVQLRPHWIYETFNLSGNAMVAFVGKADISLEHMVDLEDVKQRAFIYSPRMLHFIGEWFIDSLEVGILLQHLFTFEVMEKLTALGVKAIERRGNDLYLGGNTQRKLSVSIATRSAVSVLVHFGINIETEGTPIPTAGLSEFEIEPRKFAESVLEAFSRDAQIWQRARVKVRPR